MRILAVDDNKINVTLISKLLSMYGYQDVDVVYGGQEAVVAANNKRYELILMDLQMPVVDGFMSLARIVLSEGDFARGGPAVIALSANADEVSQV